MKLYIGIIHKDADSDYGVSFPDFPGCISAGVSLEDARAMGEEALNFHVEMMVEAGEPIPEPSTLDTVMQTPDFRDGVAIAQGGASQYHHSRRDAEGRGRLC